MCVKNQSVHRLINHLVSVAGQKSGLFDYTVVDYGSDEAYREVLRPICSHFGVDLIEVNRDTDPWRHGRAFNIGIRHYIDAGYEVVFTTGADLVYTNDFFKKALEILAPGNFVTGPLYLVRKDGTIEEAPFYYYGTLTMARVDNWKQLRGYDEDYTHWGKEDIDVAERLQEIGLEDKRIQFAWAYHQWHDDPGRRQEEARNQNEHIFYGRKGQIARNQGKEWGAL